MVDRLHRRFGAALTPDGVAVAGLALVLGAAGVGLGRPGVTLAGALIVGVIVGAEVLAAVGLAGLSVVRTVPDDPVAGVGAWGLWRVAAGRWPVPPLRLAEADGRGLVEVTALAAGEQRVAPARWRWAVRGMATFGEVVIESVGWLGVMRWQVRRLQGGAVVVGVTPREGPLQEDRGWGAPEPVAGGVDPEFDDVRPWRPGEPWRSVHAARSARAGRPLVVTRRPADDVAVGLRLRVDDDEMFEADLSAVASRVRAEQGQRFLVRCGAETLGVEVGPLARRRALDTMALWERP
ncbi:MAG: hypothetical protein RLZZ383_1936 [Pseudomonadota bacterium]